MIPVNQQFKKEYSVPGEQAAAEKKALPGPHFIWMELEWLSRVITGRIDHYFSGSQSPYPGLPAPSPAEGESPYEHFIQSRALTPPERLVLALALAAEVKPQLLDIFQTKNQLYDLPYAEFGGLLNHGGPGFVPTLQTAFFLLAGDDLVRQLDYYALFTGEGRLFAGDILEKSCLKEDERLNSTRLFLTRGALNAILHGKKGDHYSVPGFPAVPLTTRGCWDDLVLTDSTRDKLLELELWLKHSQTLLDHWYLGKKLSPGYRALFYGPPGTGKTFTAALLGQKTRRQVYRIDLARVLSKYIGETEKNLELIFNRAEKQEWILFFDEADALFARRTGITSSQDRHANQETAYLLQRIEEYPGLVILATNFKDNLDPAFLRRFQAAVPFDLPGPAERLLLWHKNLGPVSSLAPGLEPLTLAERYKLTGAAIINVIRYASLLALERSSTILEEGDIMNGIKRELVKEGKL